MTRWRDTPRHSVRRMPRRAAAVPAIVFVTGVIAAGQYLVAGLTGTRNPAGSDWRPGSLISGLVWLLVALAVGRFIWLYLRRPLVPEDEPERPQPVADDVRLRAESEQAARDERLGPGF